MQLPARLIFGLAEFELALESLLLSVSSHIENSTAIFHYSKLQCRDVCVPSVLCAFGLLL